MEDVQGRETYAAPTVVDFGSLLELTSTTHLLLGSDGESQLRDLSFSGSDAGGTSTTGAGGVTASSTPAGTAATGATPAPGQTVGGQTIGPSGSATPGATPGVAGTTTGGGAAGVGPGGESLPFTGFPAAAAAGIGSAMVAAGAAIRRLVSR
jgi:hypothetical protein